GIGIPICLQDHPASTQVDMGVPLLLRMVAEIPRVACIKAEATPSPQKIAALRAGMGAGMGTGTSTGSGSGSRGRQVPVLTGLGAVYGMFDLERGSDGFMTGFAFPEVLLAMTRAAKAGRAEEAWALYTRYLPLIVFEAQPGLAIRKELYRLRGWIAHNRVRHPGATIDAATATQLGALLRRIVGEAEPTRPVVAVR
ncbi:MAG: dihydrodipicolinate synthase family protein, partial [Candidatus Lambdaproteobacteria bacterium]|nr:dihydrodipicolinate synthase family protein [Candidatus Lambdaproteobacteria bacterium]